MLAHFGCTVATRGSTAELRPTILRQGRRLARRGRAPERDPQVQPEPQGPGPWTFPRADLHTETLTGLLVSKNDFVESVDEEPLFCLQVHQLLIVILPHRGGQLAAA